MSIYLKQARLERGYTQAQIAHVLNMNERNYRSIENSEIYPSYLKLVALETFFGKTRQELFSEYGDGQNDGRRDSRSRRQTIKPRAPITDRLYHA